MLKFLFMMIVPVFIFLYTLSFMRWMASHKHIAAAVSAGMLAFVAFVVTGVSLWRLAT